MTLTGKNLIGFRESGESSTTFHGLNPRTGEESPEAFHEATEAEIDAAFQLASEAAEDLRRRSPDEIAKFLEAMAASLESVKDELLARVGMETGYPEGRQQGEFGRTVSQIRMFAGIVREGSWVEATIETALPDRQPIPKPDLRNMLVPLGPCAVFGASNFPLAFSAAGGDAASALAAGCPIVIKGHPSHPGSSEIAARATLAAVQQCGFHDGTVSLLQGRGADVGLGMVRHPAARACGFTGSLGGGRALFDAASSRPVPIPVFAEMGSTNPICILPGKLAADPAAQAAALFGPVTGGAGQFCTKPGIILLEEGAAAETFIDAFAKLVLDHAGDVMLNRGIASSYQGGIARLGATDGVTPVALAMPADGAPAVCGCAAAFRTSAATFAADGELREELFGPWTLFVLHESAADFEATIRLLPGQLTASLHGTEEELASAAKLWDALGQRAGRIIANGYPTGVEVCNAMQHGGPYPATTDGRFTSVGGPAIRRWVRPVAFQNAPEALLPPQLHNANPMGIWRLVNNSWSKEAIG